MSRPFPEGQSEIPTQKLKDREGDQIPQPSAFFSLQNFGSHPLECCSSENSGTITVNRGKRTGKRRLFAKSQHFTGRILLRTGTNTQEGDYQIFRMARYFCCTIRHAERTFLYLLDQLRGDSFSVAFFNNYLCPKSLHCLLLAF